MCRTLCCSRDTSCGRKFRSSTYAHQAHHFENSETHSQHASPPSPSEHRAARFVSEHAERDRENWRKRDPWNRTKRGIMPWSGLLRRHGEHGGVTTTGNTGSCGIAGRYVSEALETIDVCTRDSKGSRARASRRRTRACAASCPASANATFASSSDEDDDSTTPELESPAARSMTEHPAGSSTVRDPSLEEILWLARMCYGRCLFRRK